MRLNTYGKYNHMAQNFCIRTRKFVHDNLRFASPLFSFSAFYLTFIISEAIYRYINHEVEEDLLWQAVIDQSVVIVIGLFVMLLLWGITGYQRSRIEFTAVNKEILPHYTRVRNGLLITIFLLLFAGISAGANPLVDPLGFRQRIQGGGNAYIFFSFIFFLKLYGIYFFEKKITKTLSNSDITILCGAVLFSLTSGFASLFAYVFLTGMLYLSAFYSIRIMRWYVVFAILALIIITPIYTVAREYMKINGEMNWQFILDAINRFDDSFLSVIFDRFDYYDNMIVGSRVAREHQSLSLILNLFAQPLPRSLFVDKPYNFSTLMTGWTYPANLDIGVTANFGFVPEFILYFGNFGLILGGVFFGVILFITHNGFIKSIASKANAVFYCMIILPYFGSFPIGYINDSGLPMLVLGYILWLLVYRRKKIKTQVSNTKTAI